MMEVVTRIGRKLTVLTAMLGCAVFLTACGDKDLDLPETASLDFDDAAILESYRQALKDDGIPLNDKELRALVSVGEIDRELTEEELKIVQIYFKHYVHARRGMIEKFIMQGQPYIEYTRQVFRDRGLPEDLAYLAYVESGYNPRAVSRSKATGMWQFMAGTGRQYGLKQDWWMDERRDPYRATHAAADYLSKLYGDFGDWNLAVAAYNGGEGKIGRAMAGTGASDFFELCDKNYLLDGKAQLKEETIQYVPRFLAMAKIMRNWEELGFSPAPHPLDKPAVVPAVALTARPGTDLAALATHLGMRWDEFAAYNPAFTRYITPADRYCNVYVPHYAEAQASVLLRDDKLVPAGRSNYTVAKGDTLTKISTRTGVPVKVLRQMNPKCEPLQIGARLNMPGKAGSSLSAESIPAPNPPVRPALEASMPPRQTLPTQPASSAANSARPLAPAAGPATAIATAPVPAGVPASTSVTPRPASLQAQPASAPAMQAAAAQTQPRLTQPATAASAEPVPVINAAYEPPASSSTQPFAGMPVLPHAEPMPLTNAAAFQGVPVRPSTESAMVRYEEPAVQSAPSPAPARHVAAAPSPARTATVAASTGQHTVKRGETLASIGRHYNLTLTEMRKANSHLSNPNALKVGQKINVPTTLATYKVQAGDTMYAIARKFNMPPQELLALNNRKPSAVLKVGESIKVLRN